MWKIKLFLRKYKIPIFISTIVIALIGVGFGTYKYNKVQAYNNLITTANKYMDQDDYDKASALFEQSLKYKDDSSVEKNIKLVATLKKFKEIYNDGIKLSNDKKYLEAVEKFKTIDKSGLKWYTNAQKEIKECKKQYIAQNVKLADTAFKNNKYDDTNKYLDDILKVDSNNADAKKLKNLVDEAVKKEQQNSKSEEQDKQVVQNNTDKANVQNSKDIIRQYLDQVNMLDNRISDLELEQKTYADGSEEIRQCIQKQIDLLKQRNEILEKLNNLRKQ